MWGLPGLTSGKGGWTLDLDLCRSTVVAVVRDRADSGRSETVNCPGSVEHAEGTLSPLQFIGRRSVIIGDRQVQTVDLVQKLLQQTVARVRDSAGVAGVPDSLTVAHPEDWGPVEQAVFQDAAAREGLPTPVFRTDGPPPAADTGPDHAPRRPRRTALVAGAVALATVVVAGGAVFVVNRGGGSSDASELLAEPLEVFYGDDGIVDCRRAFTDVPASTMLRAGLELKPGVDENSIPVDQDGGTACVLSYRGVQRTADTRVPPSIVVTSAPQCMGEVPAETYRGWSIGESTIVTGGDPDTALYGQSAVKEIPDHGCLSVGYPEDAINSRVDPPVASDDVIREIVDGIEDSALPATTGGTPTFLRDGRFSCSAFYDSVTLSGLAEIGVGLPLSDTAARQVADMVGHDPVLDTADGESCLISGGQRDNILEIRTGSKVERQQGYPEPELPGWELWNRPIGPEEPAARTFEGSPSVNLRVCREDDDCLSVSAYNESDSSRWADRDDYLNKAARDVASRISTVEGFD